MFALYTPISNYSHFIRTKELSNKQAFDTNNNLFYLSSYYFRSHEHTTKKFSDNAKRIKARTCETPTISRARKIKEKMKPGNYFKVQSIR